VAVSGDAQGIAFMPDGKTLIAAEGTNLWFYHVEDAQPFLHLPLSGGAQIITLAIAPDGAWLACGLLDGSVQLRALPGGELLQTLDAGSDAISSLEFSADGQTLLSGSRDGTLRFWSINR
jgi:WD40 repeat protein